MKNILILLMLLSITLNASSDRGLQLKKMQEEQRVALVIGNTNYESLSKLKNPVNDARLMKATLKKRGFEILYKENATKRDMKKLVKKFSTKLSRGGVGLYYFAGHGVNVGGQNYLVGTNSLMEDKDEVEYDTLALNFVTKKMKSAGNRLNIIILDACRNDPFSRSGGGGLAPVSNAKGIFIAYATEAGSVASDGKRGKNGIFTKYLVQNLKEEGATIERVFKNTRADVYDATNGTQSPGVYNQIRGDFFFTLATSKTVDSKPVERKIYKPKQTSKEEKELARKKLETIMAVQKVKADAEKRKNNLNRKNQINTRCKQENVLAPSWTCTGGDLNGKFSGVGIAKKSKAGMGYMRRVALVNARADLADRIKNKFGKNRRTLNKINKINLSSAKGIDIWSAPSGTMYMLVAIPENEIYKVLK